MTRDEMKVIMKYFQASYRGFTEGQNPTDVLNVWHDAFKDEEAPVVKNAAKNYVASNEFAPTVAGLMKQVEMIKSPMTDAELWACITKATKNSTYGAVEEFEKLPDVCKEFLGSASALKDLGQIDPGTLQTVVKGQFRKAAPIIRERKAALKGLPAEVKAVIDNVTEKMLIE